MIAGSLIGLVDNVAYLAFIAGQGIGPFEVVSMSIVWAYVRSFPGNVLTVLFLGSWIAAFACFFVPERGTTQVQPLPQRPDRSAMRRTPPAAPSASRPASGPRR